VTAERIPKQRGSPGGGAGPTSTETVVLAIRRRIIRGDYPPGQRLTEDALAEEYGVSRVPVRESLRILAAEGFIRTQPYYGVFVAELTPAQANDLLEVRGVLEPLAASLAAQRRTAAHLAELVAIVREGRLASRAKRYEDVSALNGRFHEQLAVASGNTSLAALISQLRDKIEWVYSVEVRRRAAASWAEHSTIVRAVKDADSEAAADAVRVHIRAATAAYRRRETPASP
jgi:DNA-binding GntR family transcriptional regulator